MPNHKMVNGESNAKVFLPNSFCMIVGLAFILTGCPYHIWEPVGSEVELSSFRVSTDIPSGWHRFYDGTDDLLMSYDGLMLQNIRIRDISWENNELKGGKIPLSNMSPKDLATWLIGSSPGNVPVLNVEILESGESVLGESTGKRILLMAKSPKGLRYKQLHYVYFQEKYLVIFSYTAVARHYFDRDQPVFENIRQSFKPNLS
ncbi:MAG: hypothetical protein KC590_15365 [Nitrospira sp.]|nr:hypothetical protein [Nitrospira sp.]